MSHKDRDDRLPTWLWFFLALPASFFVVWLWRRRAERQRFMSWQMQEGAFRERQMGEVYKPQTREAFMGESTPVDAAYSLPTAPPIGSQTTHGDEAYTRDVSLSESGFEPTTSASAYSAQMEEPSPASDEAIAADLEEEDTRMEEGQVAVTGGVNAAAEVETTEYDQTSDAMQDYRTSIEDTAPSRVQPTSGDQDDLKRIEGIGPTIARILNTQGIYTFSQLADTSVQRLDEILRQAELRRLADPGTWPEQARFAAKGDMEGLERFQSTLRAGRRTDK